MYIINVADAVIRLHCWTWSGLLISLVGGAPILLSLTQQSLFQWLSIQESAPAFGPREADMTRRASTLTSSESSSCWWGGGASDGPDASIPVCLPILLLLLNRSAWCLSFGSQVESDFSQTCFCTEKHLKKCLNFFWTRKCYKMMRTP